MITQKQTKNPNFLIANKKKKEHYNEKKKPNEKNRSIGLYSQIIYSAITRHDLITFQISH